MSVSLSALTEGIKNSIRANDIWTIALVTKTSYEVMFYALVNGELLQSNEAAERGIIAIDEVDKYYSDIANSIRQSDEYNSTKLNIVSIDLHEGAKYLYDAPNASLYRIKKEWKKSITTKM